MRSSGFPPRNCLGSTASGTGATQFVSVVMNGFSKAVPSHDSNFNKDQGQFFPIAGALMARDYLTKPFTATGITHDTYVPVAVAVGKKKTYLI